MKLVVRIVSFLGVVISAVGLAGGLVFVAGAVAFTSDTPLRTVLDPANWIGLGGFTAVVSAPWLFGALVSVLCFGWSCGIGSAVRA